MAAWKLGAGARRAGCTVVLKPAEQTPLTALVLARIFDGRRSCRRASSTSSPATGRSPARRWSTIPGVDKIAFTGGARRGTHHHASGAADTMKRMTLELGGKNAEHRLRRRRLRGGGRRRAVRRRSPTRARSAPPARGCWSSARSTTGSSRRCVEKTQRDQARRSARARDEDGPAGHRRAPREGAGLHRDRQARGRGWSPAAARARPAGSPAATYVEPTIFADVDNRARIAQEEIFGPVLTVIPFEDEDEAIAHRQRHAVRPGRRRLDARRLPRHSRA